LRRDALQRPGYRPAAPLRFRSAGRALPRPYRPLTSRVAPRHQRIGSIGSDRQLPPDARLLAHRVGFTCRVRVVPPSSFSRRTSSPLERGWRNDSRRLPSCQLPCQLALISKAFQPRRPGISRHRTRPNHAPPRCDNSARCLRTVSPEHRRCAAPLPSSSALTRRRPDPSQLISEPPSPASADSTVCHELDRPSAVCLATCREARSRYVLTNFCFPLLQQRALVPRMFPASLRDSRLALDSRACTHDQETGGSGVSRRPVRFGGLTGFMRGIFLLALPIEPYL